ncbi:MAG: EAL domain-containing protein [Pseudomonadota bacterium]
MKGNALSLLTMLAAPLLLAAASPALADVSVVSSDYEEAIGLAKSNMMADAGAALEHARSAGTLIEGDDAAALEARLTAQWLEAEALMRLNRADEAASLLDTALEQASSQFAGSKLHADLQRSKGSLSVHLGEYGTALSSFLAAHDLYHELGEDRSRAIVLQNVGSLYSDARDYERVLDYYRQAGEAYPEDKALALSAHNNIGNALKELGQFADAEAEFLEAFAVAEQMGSPVLEARILTNIASTQFLSGEHDKAEATVQRGLRIANESAPEWLPFLYGVRAQIALARGNSVRAEGYLDLTFAGEELTTTSPYFRDFHGTAFEVFSMNGDDQQAMAHLVAFHRIDNEAREISAAANNALLAARFDAANRDLMISTLSAESEAKEARLDAAQNQVILLSASAVMALFAFIAALIVLRTVNSSRRGMKAANKQLTHVIQHDALTQLFSREHFRDRLDEVVTIADDAATPAIIAFIDLDRFKLVNDMFGHAAGDELLSKVAQRFRETAGEETLIGRLGGDEFAMLLPDGMTIEQASDLADKIIAAVAEPFQVGEFEIQIGASIGISQIDHVGSTSNHMTNADLALYAAKDNGRGTYMVYEPGMRERLEDRSNLERDLEAALENGQLSVCYQPIVRSEDAGVMGVEALMRWTHPERGIVPPSVFIPVAEEARLIEKLGAWMLRSACAEAARWDDEIKLMVNISTLQMNDKTFLNVVAQALAASGLEPSRLVLELTESLILELDEQTQELLTGLKTLGVSFALDDFGRGYSSLNYIEKMDFAMIKIDREIVQSAAAGSSRSQAVVTAIVALARSLKIDVTAEGIEQEAQAKVMRELGCTCFQGYHFGKPNSGTADFDAVSRRAAA